MLHQGGMKLLAEKLLSQEVPKAGAIEAAAQARVHPSKEAQVTVTMADPNKSAQAGTSPLSCARPRHPSMRHQIAHSLACSFCIFTFFTFHLVLFVS